MNNTMKAYVAEGPNGQQGLLLRKIPVPPLDSGDVLVRIRAFPVNSGILAQLSSQYNERTVFPLIPGNELVGEVVDDPSGLHASGTKVAVAFMSGSTRITGLNSQGAFAEYIAVSRDFVFPFESRLDWSALATIPGAFATAFDALFNVCLAQDGQTLLLRGGTSGVALAAATLAKAAGLTVIATTRDQSKVRGLEEQSVDEVIIEDGDLAKRLAGRADVALHLTGFSNLPDTLACMAPLGVVCIVGMLGEYSNVHSGGLVSPHPVSYIPHSVRLTTRTGPWPGRNEMQNWVKGMEDGVYRMPIDRIYSFEQVGEALRRRESHAGLGRVIVEV
jgi:NADPH:quinone reductase